MDLRQMAWFLSIEGHFPHQAESLMVTFQQPKVAQIQLQISHTAAHSSGHLSLSADSGAG